MRYRLEGLPDDLPIGEYNVQVRESKFENGELVIVLDYDGPVEEYKTLIRLRKG